MSLKYNHQVIQDMITWNARDLARSFKYLENKHRDMIRQTAAFDMQPTNPGLDIQPTGKCEVWIREINQITQVKLNDSAFTQNTRSITTAPDLTALTNNNLRLKVPDWRQWAYTDSNCLTYKSQQRVGAEVFIPAKK